jgi:TolB-like protein/Tfp pilus assembly protein PilF
MSVAVLDFHNLSRDTADAFLGDGLAEELTSRLGQVGRLTVTSRAVVQRLPNAATMPIPQIGRTLNVSYLVNGSVRRAGTRLRVSVELLRASTGVQEWSSQYDRSESDLLTLQEEVATAVAQGVTGRLLPAERSRLAVRPTENAEAYELFLRGKAARWLLEAVAPLERAVALDSGFAAAWAELSWNYSSMFWQYQDRTAARLALSQSAAQRAVRLAPDLAVAHMAMGYYNYWGRRDYANALTEFAAALALQPNDADVHAAMANVARRQGRWEASLASRARGLALAPNDGQELQEMALTLAVLRRHDEASVLMARAVAAAPEQLLNRLFDVLLALARGGSTEGARASAVWLRAHPEAVAGFELLKEPVWPLAIVRLDTALQTQLLRLPAPASPEGREERLLARAQALSVRGDRPGSIAAYDSLRILVEEVVRERPDDEGFHAILAIAYAGIGRNADAVREAREALRLMPPERDALTGAQLEQTLAQVLLMTGDTAAALDHLERVMAGPALLTPALLRADPLYAPLRGNPRFERLIAGN